MCSQEISVIAVFVTGGHLVHPLPDHLYKGVFGVGSGSAVFQSISYRCYHSVPLIKLAQQKKASV